MKNLNNKYYAFRHGESRANVEGIIISDPVVGTVDYGLTDRGRTQVRESVAEANVFDADTLIVASDFMRAAETAEIIREALNAGPVRFDIRLRERFFGDWEGLPHGNYSKAWKQDAYDAEQVFNGAESTTSVRDRMLEVVESLEEEGGGKTIILVSHGDPLMLLLTAFQCVDPTQHRALPYFSTAEWRLLNS